MLETITEIERQYTHGDQPSLGKAYSLLREQWSSGTMDREIGLRLLFLGWYSLSEPVFCTGLPGDEDPRPVFREVFTSFGGESSNDVEFLFASGFMASLFAWCAGPEEEWQEIGERCLRRAYQLRPQGFESRDFAGRGAYGQYFAHQISCGGGRDLLHG